MQSIHVYLKQARIFNLLLTDIVGFLARILLGVIFILAAVSKIPPHTEQFATNVASYHMLPVSLATIFSHTLPWIELLLGIYLILGLFTRITTYIVIALLFMFMIAIAYAIVTNQPVSGCGCFTQAPTERIGWIDEIRDLLFVFFSFFILYSNSTWCAIDRYLFHNSHSSKE